MSDTYSINPGFLPDDLKSELENGLLSKVPEISAKLVSLLEAIKEKFPNLTGQKGIGISC